MATKLADRAKPAEHVSPEDIRKMMTRREGAFGDMGGFLSLDPTDEEIVEHLQMLKGMRRNDISLPRAVEQLREKRIALTDELCRTIAESRTLYRMAHGRADPVKYHKRGCKLEDRAYSLARAIRKEAAFVEALRIRAGKRTPPKV